MFLRKPKCFLFHKIFYKDPAQPTATSVQAQCKNSEFREFFGHCALFLHRFSCFVENIFEFAQILARGIAKMKFPKGVCVCAGDSSGFQGKQRKITTENTFEKVSHEGKWFSRPPLLFHTNCVSLTKRSFFFLFFCFFS